MATRALQAKIECNHEILEHLWRTHRVFNERLPKILSILFKMRRGECGATKSEKLLYQQIGQFITSYSSQNADYLMNSISMNGWKPGSAKKYKIKTKDATGNLLEISGESWADEAARRSQQSILLFDKQQMSGDLPACMRQMLNREAVSVISSHDELAANWDKDHEAWLREKKKWESVQEHGKYLELRQRFEDFEKDAGGKAGKRRGRWHLYLNWLRRHPELAAWRGGSAIVNELSPDAQERIQKAKPWKKRSVEAEEFWKINPEIKELDRLHGEYEREYVRRRKTKRNVDGFDHRPTFTLPHAIRHPRWFVFNAPQTNPPGYRGLTLPSASDESGSVELQLLTEEEVRDGKLPVNWIRLRLTTDPRLGRFRRVQKSKVVNRGKAKGTEKKTDAYEFYDPHLHIWRPTEISGAKLIFRNLKFNENGTLRSGTPYLIFTCNTDDLSLTDRAKKIEWSDTGKVTKSGKMKKSRKLPDCLVTCAVDLGLRHVGFATLCVYENGKLCVLRSRTLWLDAQEEGPDLARIGQHKRTIRYLRRLRGQPVKGEESHIDLQSHITHMSEDRFKKAARAILNFAWNTDGACNKVSGKTYPRADVIILEKLAGFIPDAERERGINKALVSWNRGQLVTRLKEMAIDCGYKGRVFEVHPAGTSQICSKCGALGRRYSVTRDEQTRKPEIRFGWVEKLFACPICGYRANADHNASVNLHRVFLEGSSAMVQFFTWKNGCEKDRQKAIEDVESGLRNALRESHRCPPYDMETPF